MKKTFLTTAIALICFSACNNEPKVAGSKDDETKQNIEVARIINEAFRTGDASKIDSVVSPEYIDHSDRGDMKGIDSLKAGIKWTRENMKDMKMEVRRQWADNDYVSSWMRFTGTNNTPMPGFPAGPYDWNTIELMRYKDGKLVEHWGFMEIQSVMKMMQSADATTDPMPDSTARKAK
jgi:Uncharacterized protein conserved in bacteria